MGTLEDNRVDFFKKEDGSGLVSLYKIGEVNHLVIYSKFSIPEPSVRELLCLGYPHAKRIFDGCVEELKRDEIRN